jgi:hypothetical protein
MLSVLLKTAATTARPQNAPTNDQKAPRMFPTSCFCSSRYPRNLDTGVGKLCRGEAGMTWLRYRSMSRCQLSAFFNTFISHDVHSGNHTSNEQGSNRSMYADTRNRTQERLLTCSAHDAHCAIFRSGASHPSFGPKPRSPPVRTCSAAEPSNSPQTTPESSNFGRFFDVPVHMRRRARRSQRSWSRQRETFT